MISSSVAGIVFANAHDEAIDSLNKQYASSVSRLILNRNTAGFNPIVS